ncbi:MAG: hypothetical protein ACAI35_12655 [Candidatus Methylacidiphilales bacterium]|nr:hypothetical protein [Candidatus Methylacidiphilales bacterium]
MPFIISSKALRCMIVHTIRHAPDFPEREVTAGRTLASEIEELRTLMHTAMSDAEAEALATQKRSGPDSPSTGTVSPKAPSLPLSSQVHDLLNYRQPGKPELLQPAFNLLNPANRPVRPPPAIPFLSLKEAGPARLAPLPPVSPPAPAPLCLKSLPPLHAERLFWLRHTASVLKLATRKLSELTAPPNPSALAQARMDLRFAIQYLDNSICPDKSEWRIPPPFNEW